MLESAPLRSLIGQLSLRGEFPVLRFGPQVGAAFSYEQFSRPGERDDASDRVRSLATEGVYYPWGAGDLPIFFAAGLRFEQAEIGRQRERNSYTGVRQWSHERHDRWMELNQNLLMGQAIGYRLFGFGWCTAALRLSREELIATSSTMRRDDVRAESEDLTARGRERVLHQLTMHVGLRLP